VIFARDELQELEDEVRRAVAGEHDRGKGNVPVTDITETDIEVPLAVTETVTQPLCAFITTPIKRRRKPDLRLVVDGQELTADWTHENTATQDAIAAALPLEGEASRWGDELYFRTEIDADPATTQTEVPVGAVAYWPQGNAICLFWGPTPTSHEQLHQWPSSSQGSMLSRR